MRLLGLGVALLCCAGCGSHQGEAACATELPATVTATPPTGGGQAIETLADVYMEMMVSMTELQGTSRPVMAAGPAGSVGRHEAAARTAHEVGSAGYQALQLLVRAGIDVSGLHEALRELFLAIGEIDIILDADEPDESALREPVAAAAHAAHRTSELVRAAFRSGVGFHARGSSDGGPEVTSAARRLRCLEARIGAHEQWSQLVGELEEALASGDDWQSDSYFGSKADKEEVDRIQMAPMPEPSPAPAEAMEMPSITEERREQTVTDLLYTAQSVQRGLVRLDASIAELLAMLDDTRSRNDSWRAAVRTLRDARELCEEP